VECVFEWKAIKGPECKAALRHRHEGRRAVRPRGLMQELARADFGRVDSHVRHHHHRLQRDGRRDSRQDAGHPDAARLRSLAGRGAGPGDLMRPFPAEPMRMWPISTRINKPENDDPSIVEPVELATDAA
jgi:hypothetical protein